MGINIHGVNKSHHIMKFKPSDEKPLEDPDDENCGGKNMCLVYAQVGTSCDPATAHIAITKVKGRDCNYQQYYNLYLSGSTVMGEARFVDEIEFDVIWYDPPDGAHDWW